MSKVRNLLTNVINASLSMVSAAYLYEISKPKKELNLFPEYTPSSASSNSEAKLSELFIAGFYEGVPEDSFGIYSAYRLCQNLESTGEISKGPEELS